MIILLFCSLLEVAPPDLPQTPPAELGFDEQRLERVQELVDEGIREGKMPGCVICIGRKRGIAYLRAFGNKQVEPTEVAMTVDTVFDMASITKPVATGTSIMKLIEQGRLRLAAKVVDYFPEFAPNGKDKITVHDLLIHQSGLTPDNPLKDYLEGPEVAWERICMLTLDAPVGTSFKYSDVNFIVLGKLVEKISGRDLHVFSREEVFLPLGMRETGYLPSDELRKRAATTEQREGRWMIGEVHDPRAYELKGIAGHAGLFSTATDLARYATMMLGKGTLEVNGNSVRLLSPSTVDVMTRGYRVSAGERGLSWDKRTSYSINRGDLLSDSAFGHGGFTGNVFWIDPELDLFFIFLSNRVHPRGKGLVNPLAGQILNAIVTSIVPVGRQRDARPDSQAPAEVLTGLDVLVRDGCRQIAGERIGLVTNHTGRDRLGKSIVQLLHNEPQVNLKALFGPEHGFEGKLDIPQVADSEDQQTGLKIYSLYGQTRRPTAEMCGEIDTFVFDIQDIGTRFYTYISTLGEVMRAASEYGKRLVILDRPNPIGGIEVTGPMLDPGKESFVGFHVLPLRHGMTMGELARLFQAELKLDVKLDVIPCEGWSREQLFDSTGLMWINPSPNMRSLTQALLYPGIGLLETTNLSVGRGTDTPFEVIGAPWINGRELARALRELDLPGTAFVPVAFTPSSSKFENELCQGVNILITDRTQWEPVRVGLAIACTLRRLHAQEWEVKNLVRLLGNDACYESIAHGQSLEEVMLKTATGVSDFKRRRSTFLLYQ